MSTRLRIRRRIHVSPASGGASPLTSRRTCSTRQATSSSGASAPSRRNSREAEAKAGPGEAGGAMQPEPAFAVENLPALPADTDGRTRAASGVATAAAQAFGDMWTAGPSRKRVASVAAVVVLLVVVAVIGVLALMGRNDGADSSSSVATTARSKSSTTTTSGSAAATTISPPATPSPPSALPSTPVPFTVLSTCGGRDCTVAVREGPNTAAKMVRSVRSGEVVQINCSVHGESIEDPDIGQRSDMWYRLADTSGYSSAVYLEGRTVPDCG